MIQQFSGDYRWLSNFATCYVELDGTTYFSVEHAYMSAKSDDPQWKEFCRTEHQAGNVKKASRLITLKPDWETKKVLIMQTLLEQKFSTYPFNRQLLATDDMEIQEGNTWGDTFWGVDLKTGRGKNMLGKMIMEIRSRLKEDGTGICCSPRTRGLIQGTLEA